LSEIHKFLFDGLPVRGVLVRLTDDWREVLRRRSANTSQGAYPVPLQNLLGEMAAAALLMQSSIKFDGSLVLQVLGDGPVRLAVVEVQPDLGWRATATLHGLVPERATLSEMINVKGGGRCAITLDPKTRLPGQQPYQGVVPLQGEQDEELEKFSDVIQHYMLHSEQLDTTLVLAADDQQACGLLLQRLPVQGQDNLSGSSTHAIEDQMGHNEAYQRIAMLAESLKREELLTLDANTVLHRLFWQEKLLRFEPLQGDTGAHFSCTCSRQRVAKMILGLGAEEAQSVLRERPDIEVACDFCGAQYRFDAVDVAELFRQDLPMPPHNGTLQ